MTTTVAFAVPLSHPLLPEDQVRANFYAILAALYRDAPDAALLSAIAGARPIEAAEEGVFAAAWNRLIDACTAMDAEAARQEYWDLFVGTGRSEVNLHGSHWQSGFMMEKPLVELRDDLARLGIERQPDSEQLEDHLSALFETMRLLIEGSSLRKPAALEAQKQFFSRHIADWVPALCDAINRSTLANFYVPVGQFTNTYVALERDSFAIG